jgi:integrase/recombinase XerD
MLCVAYETLARRGNLAALQVRDIDFHPNGSGQALIRRGKTDAEGQGRMAYPSRETVRWLKVWLEHAEISEGALFRRLIGRDQVGGSLNPGSIARVFKLVAQWIGMPARFVEHISGHSTRVGAAQDLAELDIDLAAITQVGGWKSTKMPRRSMWRGPEWQGPPPPRDATNRYLNRVTPHWTGAPSEASP